MKLLLAPHSDDETLFAAFTLMREQPLVAVVTDCFVQFNRTPSVSWQRRRDETIEACKVLGVSVVFLGLPDDHVTEIDMAMAFRQFANFDLVYAPALQGGHHQHDMVHRAAMSVFSRVQYYGTYSERERSFATEGAQVTGTGPERNLKSIALSCYKSQHEWSAEHFAAARFCPEFVL